jgi:hypothetical protein
VEERRPEEAIPVWLTWFNVYLMSGRQSFPLCNQASTTFELR